MRTTVVLLIFTALALILYSAYEYATSSPFRITSQEAKRRISAGEIDLILDVRTDLEVKTLGFYPGSVHIQSADLEKEMSTRYPDKGIRILAYCNTGQRARAATDKLHALGYEKAVFIVTPYTSLQ
jgi:rhodanese-related sulfurtransferase